eukprot:CAMPEP_0181309738 /NCGR_PEP_ID=MMETSP1101-20121128/12179_1 /TAXON_ID=46948 /ORGANISM="Rhodomonas abbreviata, Strain Caron Lab Isolate" /LENGTH=191 /DNA_ID=CAMNT_0023416253 /DNA_START=37 /DNA_END=608 /DNA_ORIENTATION=-
MSRRALKRLEEQLNDGAQAKKSPPKDESEESEEDETPPPKAAPKNAFSLLLDDEGEGDDDDDDDENEADGIDEKEPSSTPKQPAKPVKEAKEAKAGVEEGASQSKKKKNKKKKKKQADGEEEEDELNTQDFAPSEPLPAEAEGEVLHGETLLESLLRVDKTSLNADKEMRRLFGAGAMAAGADRGGRGQRG